MDLNFVDPSEAPVPPDEVRVRRIDLRPLPDGGRIKVQIELTPFQERPTLEVEIRDPAGDRVSQTSIIESVYPQLEFTMHLKDEPRKGPYELQVQTGYGEGTPVDVKSIEFTLEAT